MARTTREERIDAAEVARRSRRRFLQAAAATGGALTFGGLGPIERAFAQGSVLPPPDASGIEHIVVVMMENRSFDHMLGWLEGADGRQRGLTYLDAGGIPIRPTGSRPTTRAAAIPIPITPTRAAASSTTAAHATAGCAPATTTNTRSATTRRRTWRSSPAPRRGGRSATATSPRSWRGRSPIAIYQHAAQTDRLANTFELSTLPTIWDRLADAGLEGRYYFSDLPFLALWGSKYLSHRAAVCGSSSPTRPRARCPHVSFVEPRFLGEEIGRVQRRSSVRRHAERPGVHEPGVFRGHAEPGLAQHGARDQLRRVGWLLRSRAAARRADSAGRSGRGQPGRPARIPDALPRRLALRAARARVDLRRSITRRCSR